MVLLLLYIIKEVIILFIASFPDEQSLSAMNQNLFMITLEVVLSTSKISSLKINSIFNENFQMFGPSYCSPFNIGPISAT